MKQLDEKLLFEAHTFEKKMMQNIRMYHENENFFVLNLHVMLPARIKKQTNK